MKQVIVIGAGFSGMAAAAVLAQQGYEVQLIEQHSEPGGRCRTWKKDGFTFDMGPSWYWMPDVFERFYQRFGHTTSDFYELERLDPSYQVFFEDEAVEIPANYDELKQLFEQWEPGSGEKLDKFMADAEYKYEVGMRDLVYKPSFSLTEFVDARLLTSLFKMNLFSSLQNEVRSLFSDRRIQKLLEFPVLFLGAKPSQTPALYSLMNYADVKLGTWYPMGGMHNIAKAFEQIAKEQGVKFHYNQSVVDFTFSKDEIVGVQTNKQSFENVEFVVSGADYHFTEQLLPEEYQSYTEQYWENRKLSPSCLLYYIGLDKKLTGVEHHNLFFDAEFELHAQEIYDHPSWPTDPLFYACVPSVTDESVAPKGMENLFLLMPIAPDLAESEEVQEAYFQLMIRKLEKKTNQSILPHVVVKRSFGVQDFKTTYNAFKGNAYGLANTLLQTAILKPRMRSKKLNNLFYCGQLTVPGPGVPPSIISGQVIADYITKQNKAHV